MNWVFLITLDMIWLIISSQYSFSIQFTAKFSSGLYLKKNMNDAISINKYGVIYTSTNILITQQSVGNVDVMMNFQSNQIDGSLQIKNMYLIFQPIQSQFIYR